MQHDARGRGHSQRISARRPHVPSVGGARAPPNCPGHPGAMPGSKPGSRGSKASSRQSARSVPPPINTDLDRKGRTPEENAERRKPRAAGPAHAPAADPAPADAARTPDPQGRHEGPGRLKGSSSSQRQTPTKHGADQGTAQPTDGLWEFLTAFQHAIEHLLHDKIVRSPSAENDRPGSAPDNHERATQLLFRVFKTLAASSSEGQDDKHSNSMDLEEFLVPIFVSDALV